MSILGLRLERCHKAYRNLNNLFGGEEEVGEILSQRKNVITQLCQIWLIALYKLQAFFFSTLKNKIAIHQNEQEKK